MGFLKKLVQYIKNWFSTLKAGFVPNKLGFYAKKLVVKAESSVRQSANWFSIENMAGDVSRANMSIAAGQQYDALLRDLTNVSTFLQTYSGGLSPVVPPPLFQ